MDVFKTLQMEARHAHRFTVCSLEVQSQGPFFLGKQWKNLLL